MKVDAQRDVSVMQGGRLTVVVVIKYIGHLRENNVFCTV